MKDVGDGSNGTVVHWKKKPQSSSGLSRPSSCALCLVSHVLKLWCLWSDGGETPDAQSSSHAHFLIPTVWLGWMVVRDVEKQVSTVSV